LLEFHVLARCRWRTRWHSRGMRYGVDDDGYVMRVGEYADLGTCVGVYVAFSNVCAGMFGDVDISICDVGCDDC